MTFRITCQISKDYALTQIAKALHKTKYWIVPYEDVYLVVTDFNTTRWTEDNVSNVIEEDLLNLGLIVDYTKVLRIM